MKRTTFLLAALVILLVAGVLLVMGMAAPKPQPAVAAADTPSTGATPAAPGMRASSGPASSPAIAGPLPLEPGAHDPVMIKEGDYYYVFFTGGLINELRSKDLVHWDRVGGGRALPGIPNWIAGTVPANRGDLWAPDIAFYKGRYLLYYAASTFGQRTSGIGLATTKALDPASKDFKWQDDGLIVRSQNSDNYNAIDPNFVLDEKGQPWLNFGSFWSGIKLIKLNEEGKPDEKDKTVYALAARAAGSTAIEAPFIIREGKYFYLFVSWDRCCQGVRSTYRIMVGRAEKITGPYVDKENVDMARGGGTQILAGDGQRLIGPGHCGLFKDGDHWLMVHHFYDGNTNGTSRLQVRPVTFDDKAWPVLGKAINSPN